MPIHPRTKEIQERELIAIHPLVKTIRRKYADRLIDKVIKKAIKEDSILLVRNGLVNLIEHLAETSTIERLQEIDRIMDRDYGC